MFCFVLGKKPILIILMFYDRAIFFVFDWAVSLLQQAGFSSCGALTVEHEDSVVLISGLSPRPGIDSVALKGGFLTTGPRGKFPYTRVMFIDQSV